MTTDWRQTRRPSSSCWQNLHVTRAFPGVSCVCVLWKQADVWSSKLLLLHNDLQVGVYTVFARNGKGSDCERRDWLTDCVERLLHPSGYWRCRTRVPKRWGKKALYLTLILFTTRTIAALRWAAETACWRWTEGEKGKSCVSCDWLVPNFSTELCMMK